MKRMSRASLLCLLLLSLPNSNLIVAQESQGSYPLLMADADFADVADGPDVSRGLYLPGVRVELDNGPTVIVERPVENAVESPLVFGIRIEARGDSIDMDSLEIRGQKWVLGGFRGNKDLLPRLGPFISPQGVFTEPMQLDSGQYSIRLSIQDVSGQQTVAVLVFEVI